MSRAADWRPQRTGGWADAVLAAAARLDTEGDDLVDLFRGVSVDDVLVVEDDDQEQDEEGSR